jgi:hypothetical protein
MVEKYPLHAFAWRSAEGFVLIGVGHADLQDCEVFAFDSCTPADATALSGWHSPGDDLKVHWSSVPSFKTDGDFMMACVWLVELAEANAHLWREVWEMYFGETPTFVVPGWKFGASNTSER